MSRDLVSVVVETVTAREDGPGGALADSLAGTIAAIAAQIWPADSIETILVLDAEVSAPEREAIAGRYPAARIVDSRTSNYFEAKNAGAAAASGAFVALIDGDCEPDPSWLERLMARFEPGVAAVAGRTRYGGTSRAERIFSIPDFAYVVDSGGGRASGFNINNVVFRRETLLAHPFESRIARNGGCYFLFHRLRAAGALVLYEADAVVRHGNDVAGLGFVRKHFDRGHDGVDVYRLDRDSVLRGTRLFRRLGPLALAGFSARRTLIDWRNLVRHRRQIGIGAAAIPFYCAVAFMLRSIELCGAMKAVAFPRNGKARPRLSAAA
jgi:glycosyltransferase involved in cell wall biosynthesis